MDFGLNRKTALVLGAGGGLGGAIARSLAAEGAAVAVADIDASAAENVGSAINRGGGRSMALTWDLGDLAVVNDRVVAVEERLGPVDILVSLTGGPPPGGIVGQPVETWRTFFDSMVLSVMTITDRVVPGMKERGWGRIITSTSSGVVAPIPNLGLSNALRSTLVGWSKTLAGELGHYGITANIVMPGRIATKRIAFLDEKKASREGRTVDDISRESIASIPIGRYGDPAEYGDAVAFLASTRASYITGSSIRIDGGYIANV